MPALTKEEPEPCPKWEAVNPDDLGPGEEDPCPYFCKDCPPVGEGCPDCLPQLCQCVTSEPNLEGTDNE